MRERERETMRLRVNLFVLLAAISIITSTQASGQEQLWSFDFGDFIGEKTSGDDTNFILQNQSNGGIFRVRTGVNNDGRDIIISDIDNMIGTYSRMILDAGSTAARNIFEIQGFDATEFFYLRASIKIIAEGKNNLEIFIGDENSAGNALSLGSLAAGIRFSVQEDQETGELYIDKQRKSGTGSGINSAHDFNLNLVELNKKHIIEIYINNSPDDYFYYRNGISYSIGSQQQAYWIDRNFVAAGPGSANGNHQGSPLAVGEKISVIRLLGGSVNGEIASMEVDDIIYANHLPVLRDISGGEGWRMLAAPSDKFNIENLNRQNHVQGITGAAIEAGIANIYTFDPEASGNSWIKPGNTDDILEPGTGFIWYLYDNDTYLPGKPLPFSLVSNGKAMQSDVSVSLSSYHADNIEGQMNGTWNLIGNPFGTDIKLDTDEGLNAWVSGGNLMSNTAQVWQSTGNYKVINAGENIAAFQGFFIHNHDALEMTFPHHTSGNYDAEFFKDNIPFRLVSFQLEAIDSRSDELFIDEAFQLYFHADAHHDWDMRDAHKIVPLSNRYVNIAFIGELNGEIVLKAQDSRPFDPGEKLSIPVVFQSSGVSGAATLSIKRFKNIPYDWKIIIEDTFTGYLHHLDLFSSFKFNFKSNIQRKKNNDLILRSEFNKPVSSDLNSQYILHIYPGLADEQHYNLPDKAALYQNFPNPFNPITHITFDLPEQAEVNLSVFDILGRRVAVVADGKFMAGSHKVTFDASTLSSGVYIYTLTSTGINISRKFTVLK